MSKFDATVTDRRNFSKINRLQRHSHDVNCNDSLRSLPAFP